MITCKTLQGKNIPKVRGKMHLVGGECLLGSLKKINNC